jgi:hypothetical protein
MTVMRHQGRACGGGYDGGGPREDARTRKWYGYSGGACNGGPLPIGAWWPGRALVLAKFQTHWIRPPRGTRYGLFKRYAIKDVAGDGFRAHSA